MSKGYAVYDKAQGCYVCTWPGCTFADLDAGTVRLHHHTAHIRPKGAGRPPGPGRCVCGEVLRLLRGVDPAERAAQVDGYRYVCDSCGEVCV